MENILNALLRANSAVSRKQWALDYKKQGGKVIGITSSYVPEEIIMAANMLPWRITGSWNHETTYAGIYRNPLSCAYCSHVLESVLNGDLDFLDGIIVADHDQDMLRLGDVIKSLKKFSFFTIIHVPYVSSEINFKFMQAELERLISELEHFNSSKVSETSIETSINTCNKMRDVLSTIYELRKSDTPPLSGAEVLGLITAAQIMPKEEFTRKLIELLPYIKSRKTSLKNIRPRIFVSSEKLDDPAYISLIEENSVVVMDDLDNGSRYFPQNVEVNSNPLYAIAKRYISRHGSPRMTAWDKQISQIITWVKEYRIDGVISLPLSWCYPQRFRLPLLKKMLQEAGIPSVSFEREYQYANVGQLRTRIEAFLETL
ncbi:MAG: 2-hydroxyacyl-CoA dehydratase [Dehalococcoidales bacterium]|nr:2-hydroxyacyl-CoA dehydratase [Dehalococcoidales bacterium]